MEMGRVQATGEAMDRPVGPDPESAVEPCPGPVPPQTSHKSDPDDPGTWCPECAPDRERAPAR